MAEGVAEGGRGRGQSFLTRWTLFVVLTGKLGKTASEVGSELEMSQPGNADGPRGAVASPRFSEPVDQPLLVVD